MNSAAVWFESRVVGPAEDIGNHLNVTADASFVSMEDGDGSVMISFKTAEELIPVLVQAVAFAREEDAKRDRSTEARETIALLEEKWMTKRRDERGR